MKWFIFIFYFYFILFSLSASLKNKLYWKTLLQIEFSRVWMACNSELNLQIKILFDLRWHKRCYQFNQLVYESCLLYDSRGILNLRKIIKDIYIELISVISFVFFFHFYLLLWCQKSIHWHVKRSIFSIYFPFFLSVTFSKISLFVAFMVYTLVPIISYTI